VHLRTLALVERLVVPKIGDELVVLVVEKEAR
jgi:hypothetical protein